VRIIVITDKSERHYYFASRIISATGKVVGVFCASKNIHQTKLQVLKKIIKRKIIIRTALNKIFNLIFRKYGLKFNERKEKAEWDFFCGSSEKFIASSDGLVVEYIESKYGSINNMHYVDKIRSLSPDVIVVMGACLLGRQIINSATYVINMHTGLSPYYRGGFTNFWPFIKKEYGYFGVTIHMLSCGIDSGDIVYTARPEISYDDDFASINCKSIILGTDLMVQTMELISSGKLCAIKQWTKGFVFHNHDWNYYYVYKYFSCKSKYVSRYKNLEYNNSLDDVNLVNNGRLM
jgi:methionyl-tRNA formyltransferase